MKNNNIYFKMDHTTVKTSYSFHVVPANYSKTPYRNHYRLSRDNPTTGNGLFKNDVYLEGWPGEPITNARTTRSEYSGQRMLEGTTNDRHDTYLKTPTDSINSKNCIIQTNASTHDRIDTLQVDSDEEDYTLNPDFDDEDDNDSDKDNKITKHKNTRIVPIGNKSYK